MLEMAINGAKLFLAGKLFQSPQQALMRLAMGAGAGAVVLVVVGLVAPLWAAALAGGAVSGLLQPFLFKSLKFA